LIHVTHPGAVGEITVGTLGAFALGIKFTWCTGHDAARAEEEQHERRKTTV
jgi:hypothetical protein